jgi:hypothetical protein
MGPWMLTLPDKLLNSSSSINLEDLQTYSSMMLIGVGFACVVHRGECACAVSVCVELCNLKKKLLNS